MTSGEKTKFRTTKEWKEFRLKFIQSKKNTCELCGITKKSSLLQVHHLDPTNYTNLNENKFACLCSSCHKLVERLSRRKYINPDLEKVVKRFLVK